jgi:hypothetical protein
VSQRDAWLSLLCSEARLYQATIAVTAVLQHSGFLNPERSRSNRSYESEIGQGSRQTSSLPVGSAIGARLRSWRCALFLR